MRLHPSLYQGNANFPRRTDCQSVLRNERRSGSKTSRRLAVGRPALTLLEVVISVAIFLFALVAIGRLVIMGTDKAAEARNLSRATMLCQSKLAEVIAGAESLTSSGSYTPFEEDSNWQWRLECDQSEVTGLYKVQVWVQRQGQDNNEVSLIQYVLSPSLRGSSADKPATTTPTSGGSP